MGRWADLASTRWIAKADVDDALNTGLTTSIGNPPIIGPEQFITKSQMQTWINTSSVTGASNQWITKGGVTLITPPTNSYTLYIRVQDGTAALGFNDASSACAATLGITVYSYDNPLVVGSSDLYWYGEAGGSVMYPLYGIPYDASGGVDTYYKLNGNVIRLTNISNGSSIANRYYDIVQSCTTSTAYTARPDFSTTNICTASTQSVYTSGSWGTGVIVYTDATLTSPLTGYNYIVEDLGGVIYEMNTSTGEITSNTGLIC